MAQKGKRVFRTEATSDIADGVVHHLEVEVWLQQRSAWAQPLQGVNEKHNDGTDGVDRTHHSSINCSSSASSCCCLPGSRCNQVPLGLSHQDGRWSRCTCAPACCLRRPVSQHARLLPVDNIAAVSARERGVPFHPDRRQCYLLV